jgi:[ribosomal protein S5]-alanine N-acetyltransferase
MELITTRLLLREFRQSDLDELAAYASQPELRRYEKGLPDRESSQLFLERTIRRAAEKPRKHFCLAIKVPPIDKVIGHISLNSQNPEIKEWEIGWTIRMEDWGKGYASEAAHQMLEYALHDLNAHRVVAFCHAENAASAKVMGKIGMNKEGCLRQTRWFNDGWVDELVYAILESDYKNYRA